MLPGERKPRKSPAEPDELPVAKRPWQQPRVRTGHLFESNSLSCGKNGSTPIEQCMQNPLTS